ncbi:TonB-dependent receptor [candidate division KSB1 bacterium]|nr:TonB-dependent receptor [candidate division KSB1 bacterium]
MYHRVLTSAVAILLFAGFAVAQNGKSIRGRIIDAQTGMPLPDANVFVVPEGPGTVSEADGRFQLAIVPGMHDSLHIRFMGYRAATLAIASTTDDLQVRLQPRTVLFREVVVTATREANSAANVPVTTEVVEVASAAHATRQTVGEVLTEAQSVFVRENGGLSGLKTVSLRGTQASQVLILQDNFRLNNPQNGLVDLSVLPLLGIDRIEVARGGSSAQYGSEAIGGVIHLRTLPPPSGFSGNAEYTLGDFGTDIKRLRLGHAAGPVSTVIGYGRVRTNGDFEFEDASRQLQKRANNALDRREFFLQAEANFSPTLKAKAFHQNVVNEQGVPGSLSFASTTAKQDDKNHLTGLGLQWQKSRFLQLVAQAGYQRLDQTYAEPLFDFKSNHDVKSAEFILHNRSQLHRRLDLLYGVEFSHHALESTDLGKPKRDQRSAFVQAEWRHGHARDNRWSELLIMPALRFDDYSDAGRRVTPKLGVAWRRLGAVGFTARVNAGQSFRVPNMNELFWPSSPYYSGNPNLQPETGSSFDGGVVLQIAQHGNWQAELNGFYSTLDDLIIDTPDATGLLMPQNIDKAKLRGIESALAWHSNGDRFMFKIAHTYLKATNESERSASRGKQLIYRPQDKLDASLGWRAAQINFSVSYQFIGKRLTPPDQLGNTSLPAYRLVHLAASREIAVSGLRLQVAGAIHNVFDKRIQIFRDYPIPGREWRLTMRVGR